VIGYLQVINEVVKNGLADQVQVLEPTYLETIGIVNETTALSENTLLRKMRAKLMSRMVIRLLPTPKIRRRGRILDDAIVFQQEEEGSHEESEVPEIVETLLQSLLDALQDKVSRYFVNHSLDIHFRVKDTIVRWSAAKGLARITERLPSDFAPQILDSVMDMFSIHLTEAANLGDLPAVAEATWHGAALACAEIARRGLVASDQLPILIGWISKALYFDLRKGSHSIGSNIRDAAAYVIWSLARTQNVASLQPYATDLARRLITVALFDREPHIRRAASAAFQEHVGRTVIIMKIGSVNAYLPRVPEPIPPWYRCTQEDRFLCH